MKTLINTLVLVAVAISFSACGSTTTNVYPTRTVYVPSKTKSSSTYKSRPSSYSSDPVRSGKRNPDSVEPVRAPSTYSR